MSGARSRSYETHFYCALCGGPFAQVFRTAVSPATPSHTVPNHHEIYDCGTNEDDDDYDENLNLKNEFNVRPEDNRKVPEDVVLNNMSDAAKRSRNLRLRAEKEGRRRGMMGERRTTWQAYDGRRISTEQMRWTKNLRALICKKAVKQPSNYDHYLIDDDLAYLTGRGLVRQEQNWADAFASIDEDEGDGTLGEHTEHPIFSDEHRANNTYGFHLYQELGRADCRYVISSIPFHDECWSLLDLAIEESGKERGIEGMNEHVDMNNLWRYFRGFITGMVEDAIVPYSTAAVLSERGGGEIVTRLGEVDYREGQGSGDGWQWKHEEGLHWLAADPSSISVLNSPLLPIGGPQSRSCAPRAALQDPFQSLPPEILLEICRLLTSTDIFSLKTATPAVHNVCLPDSFYRRFLREEFQYLPTLAKEVKSYESARYRQKLNKIDWKGSFERLRKLMVTPNGHSDNWDHVDIGLKNRNRIWKIVKPMADELVESSSVFLQHRYNAPEAKAEITSVVRGYAGVRTGKEGTMQSVYFGPRTRLPSFEGEDEKALEVVRQVYRVRIWLDRKNGPLCGIDFFIRDQEGRREWQRFGRGGSRVEDLEIRPNVLTGFVVCLENSVICGIQLVFNDGQISPKRVGQWNGCVRKIAVPIACRKLVGIVGFVNSGGFIETLGALEETLDREREDEFGRLPTAPLTVDLFHGKASVWKRLPPRDERLEFLEREGPHIMDWRMSVAEWEVWENGFHEEGVETQLQKERSLLEIVGYYDDVALRGLEFIYEERGNGQRITSLWGSREASKRDSIRFKKGESMAAIVICFSNACVHGILFVTESGCKSEVFGPRYLGTHKVFAPTANINGPSQTVYRTETTGKIVGLHCLYDQEERKFLQLGLILLIDQDKIYETPLPCPIPFNDVDNFRVWDDKPPPKEWSIGHKPGDMGIFDKTFIKAQYSGWVPLRSLSKITIYGGMKGIKFSFAGTQKKDKFFGYDGAENGEVYVQDIDHEHGERIVGIAILLDEKVACSDLRKSKTMNEEHVASISNGGDFQPSLGRIHFLTNRNQANLLLPAKYRVLSPYLEAVRFDFDYDQLVSWAPIYAPNPGEPESFGTVKEMVRYPWKCRTDDVVPDEEIKATSHVACIFFDEELVEDQRADAVKGYVSKSGRFCGLAFRRNGNWGDKVFGHRSAYEVTMELGEGERFTSLYLPEGNTEALALCTNLGRTTPLFGKTASKPLRLKKTLGGREAVGIYGTLDGEIPMFNTESIVLNTIGLLHRRKKSPRRRNIKPTPPGPSGFQLVDKTTNLPWFSYTATFPPNLEWAPLVAQRTELYLSGPVVGLVGRTYTIFDPAQLGRILVYANRPNHAGITSIRFQGTGKMGLITMGEWPDSEDIRIKPQHKMSISGSTGERIIKVKVAFQRLDSKDHIVGLAIETNLGMNKTIVSSEMSPEKTIHLSPDNVKVLDCDNDHEIVGFHGIVSTHNIHDIGLILQRKNLIPEKI